MGAQLLLSLRKSKTDSQATVQRRPFMTGVVLTGANPYFLFWWATVGLTLATQATKHGAAALIARGARSPLAA